MGLLDSPMVQGLFMKQAKKLVKEHGLKAIVIVPDANDDLEFKLHKEDIVILTRAEFDKMVKQITNGI
jgi:hypothetical protein